VRVGGRDRDQADGLAVTPLEQEAIRALEQFWFLMGCGAGWAIRAACSWLLNKLDAYYDLRDQERGL
jgi:hypothetical protein